MRLCYQVFAASFSIVSCSNAHDNGPLPERQPATESTRSVARAPFERVWVTTAPNADCRLHPTGVSDPAHALTVYADERGLASFRAPHLTSATPAEIPTHLSLDCDTGDGTTVSHSIDLTADATFRAPIFPETSPSLRRPALTGDPMSYSQSELIRNGYGLRPDPVKAPGFYASWAAAASKEGKLMSYKPGRQGVPPQTGLASTRWGGEGLVAGNYAVAAANYQVPTYAQQQQNSQAGIWAGLGGANKLYPNDVTIIQCGIRLVEENWAETTDVWTEYASSSVLAECVTIPCPWPMTLETYDTIISYSWACDSAGNVNPNGGYGCFYLTDQSSTPVQVLSCTSPYSGGSGCFSVPQPSPFLGLTANFIIEKQDTPLTGYDTLDMSAAAIDYSGTIRDFSTDRYRQWNLKNLANEYLESASVTGAESIHWDWIKGQ
jgi:hypothetical protein